MVKSSKGFGKMFSENNLVWGIAGLFLLFLMMRYNDKLGSPHEGMSRKQVWQGADAASQHPMSQDVFQPDYMSVHDGNESEQVSPPPAQTVPGPSELLPADQQKGGGGLSNVNLLRAGYHAGINTVGSSLRNANLQVRSEPPNPQVQVSPWGNTTIQPDLMRVPLEIGCGSQ